MKSYKILVITFFTFLGFSCKKDFLEVIDNTVLLKQGYVKDLETTGHFLNGIYVNLAGYYVNGQYLPYSEILADDMKPTGTLFADTYNWNIPKENGGEFGNPEYMWRKYYGIIRDCSYVIEKAGEFRNENQQKADDYRGQALAIRALMHFVLVNIFSQAYNYTVDGSHAGIPLVKTSDTEPTVTRQTTAEVYNGIISDLDQAVELLPASGYKKEVMNLQAAKALLGRVYLFKEDYVNAKNLSMQVLNAVPLMTTGYPDKLYATDESEALFRMPPGNPSTATDGYSGQFIGFYARLTTPRYWATNDIANILREDVNDKRRNWVTTTTSGWRITKFPIGAAGGLYASNTNGDHYQTIIRSTEMCLTAAEAYAKLGGGYEDSARLLIDAIRFRANTKVTKITATGTALLDSIYKERRKEMCFDGLRMFDLLRWKKGVNRQDALSPAAQTLPYPSDKAIAPIPKTEVELSGLEQNPNY